MNFLKPKFWDRKQISFFAIFLFPISLCIKLTSYFKFIFGTKQSFPIPVICVGNIYLGGTGKTPFCIELFSILKKLNKNPVFIRKKYESFQDEINILKNIGDTYENKKRTIALKDAIKSKFNIAVLDDGFQDFSIKKDLSIVCFNEKQWIGNGLVIPSGPLREDLSALSRVNYVIINGKKNTEIENKILEKNKLIKIFYTSHEPQNINEFKNDKIICFAGIGNTINFFDLLKKNKIIPLEQISFPDHHNYSTKELNNLIKKAKNNNAILLTTEKDYLRIDNSYKQNIKFLKIKTKIENEKDFIKDIENFI